jgi:hypothetical protein
MRCIAPIAIDNIATADIMAVCPHNRPPCFLSLQRPFIF